MSIKKFNAITPSLRHRKIVASIKHDPFEPLLKGKPSPGFRNNTGRITVRHRGGGHKRRMRIIDLSYKNSKNTPYEIVRLDYDPNRTGYLALCRTIPKLTVTSSSVSEKWKPVAKDGVWINNHKYFYILASEDHISGKIEIEGKRKELKEISIGSEIHSIEIEPGSGSKLVRSAGTLATLLGKTRDSAMVLLPSQEVKNISLNCEATLGRVSNSIHAQTKLGKAGASRWLGRRPIVRGEATNPIDHPHGGKTRGGRPLKNIWGKLAKWVPLKRKFIK